MRVSEVYASVQGEGPRVGETTVFVRFGGCNLRCPGWPCDTQHAINPAFRSEWLPYTPEELLIETYGVARLTGAKLITLTGGEPFLQKNSELHEFVDGLHMMGYSVECFSNGTLLYPDWAPEMVHFIMDWKLPGSGEDHNNPNRYINLKALDESILIHAAKFVCKDEVDFQTAYALWSMLPEGTRTALQWYYGRVWDGTIENKRLAELVMKNRLPWKMNVQLHNYVWPANERGR